MAGNGLRYMLHVTNIPWTVGRHELALYFSRFGYVQEAYVAFDKRTGLHRGNGHITFLKKQVMDTVLGRKHELEGKELVLLSKKNGEGELNNDSNI